MIQKHSTSKFATKLKFKIYKPNKNSQFFLCVSTNTDINKLNWRFNHIFLVITNRDFYCMIKYFQVSGSLCSKFLISDRYTGSRRRYLIRSIDMMIGIISCTALRCNIQSRDLEAYLNLKSTATISI